MPIKIIRDVDQRACGGTKETLNTDAPKTIKSKEMIMFDVSSALGQIINKKYNYQRISAFAAPAKKGTFIVFKLEEGDRYDTQVRQNIEYIKADIFSALVELVEKYDIVKGNGSHSHTYGLPEDFGGYIEILYGGGEAISISNNQSPVLSIEQALAIAEAFEASLKKRRVSLPKFEDLVKIIYDEKRKDGGFTHRELAILPDGTGRCAEQAKYEGTPVYEKEYVIAKEKIDGIKRNIEGRKMFAWGDLPQSRINVFRKDETLKFVFSNGDEIIVPEDRELPLETKEGFFNVYFAMLK
ncbi:MAG: hypothetical protein IJS93_00405 [Clostridia bacterium]|nr:hypothetical protein [Clostridia bacterium]